MNIAPLHDADMGDPALMMLPDGGGTGVLLKATPVKFAVPADKPPLTLTQFAVAAPELGSTTSSPASMALCEVHRALLVDVSPWPATFKLNVLEPGPAELIVYWLVLPALAAPTGHWCKPPPVVARLSAQKYCVDPSVYVLYPASTQFLSLSESHSSSLRYWVGQEAPQFKRAVEMLVLTAAYAPVQRFTP